MQEVWWKIRQTTKFGTLAAAHMRVVIIFYGTARSTYEIARAWVPGELG